MWCHTILFDVDVPLVTKKQWSALKMRAHSVQIRHGTVVIQQLAQFFHRVYHVGRSMFSP